MFHTGAGYVEHTPHTRSAQTIGTISVPTNPIKIYHIPWKHIRYTLRNKQQQSKFLPLLKPVEKWAEFVQESKPPLSLSLPESAESLVQSLTGAYLKASNRAHAHNPIAPKHHFTKWLLNLQIANHCRNG